VSAQEITNWELIYGSIKLLIYNKAYFEQFLVIYLKSCVFYLKVLLIQLFERLSIKNDFLSDVAAFEGIIIGLSIPISLQVVSWIADRYEDNEISQVFIKEPLYKWQFYLIMPNIAISILLRLFNVEKPIILVLIYLWFLINIFIFYKFIKLVEQYTTNTDKVLIKIFRKNVDDMLEE